MVRFTIVFSHDSTMDVNHGEDGGRIPQNFEVREVKGRGMKNGRGRKGEMVCPPPDFHHWILLVLQKGKTIADAEIVHYGKIRAILNCFNPIKCPHLGALVGFLRFA